MGLNRPTPGGRGASAPGPGTRRRVSVSLDQACAAGARLERAGAAVGLSERTRHRWPQAGAVPGDGRGREQRAADRGHAPAHRFSPEAAWTWMAKFAPGYNDAHHHRPLKPVTPAPRHRGEDTDLLAPRQTRYHAAKAPHPERWSGPTRNWQPPATVFPNPGKPSPSRNHPIQTRA